MELANAVARYHREQQGKAPERIKVTVTANLVVAVSSDSFTPGEDELRKTSEGRQLIKSARRENRSLTREAAHAAISRVVGCPVVRSFWDFDIRIGEQLEAYVLSEDIEQRLSSASVA